ncbi:HTH domain-containing protein [Haloarcula nitratireducens]|uniref:Uncharacterized protein n=1 Tax=Haloarcula nitratireducens TaxID=2487749 RepID=A0AAW4PKZ6_9EURY|nr:HTH domain-containing protein [Halomicroarcula nitratireducens]MBX0298188.1 hypothetical protein [Halomicroarcula nitratireducens]
MNDDTPAPYIELYVRSMLPNGAHERQEDVINQLQTLEEDGQIDGFNVIVWGKRIAPQSAAARTEEGRYILNRVAEFKQWALSNNVSFDSFHQRTGVDSDIAESSYEAVVLPVMGIAEYTDNELSHVAPCTEGDVVHTIMDRINRLDAGQPSALEQETVDVSLV